MDFLRDEFHSWKSRLTIDERERKSERETEGEEKEREREREVDSVRQQGDESRYENWGKQGNG